MRAVIAVLALGAASFATAAAPIPSSAPIPELVVYTYDSFVAKGGLGPEIFALFEKRCGCRIRALAVGDGGQLLTRLQLDSARPGSASRAQIVLGVDQLLWPRLRSLTEPWGKWTPRGYGELAADAIVEKGFLPFDYGYFAWIAEEGALVRAGLEAPRRLADLLRPAWRRRLILEDPRTSTPGLAWLLYANQVSGEGAPDFWSRFRGQWLTLAPGWDAAYGLFTRGEAPLVWSYTTSQAFHDEHPPKPDAAGRPLPRFRATLLDEGQPLQIEGAALVAGASADPASVARSREFLEFLITPEVQRLVPLRNWMYPARRGTPLPASFARVPRPARAVRLEAAPDRVEAALRLWSRAVEGGR